MYSTNFKQRWSESDHESCTIFPWINFPITSYKAVWRSSKITDRLFKIMPSYTKKTTNCWRDVRVNRTTQKYCLPSDSLAFCVRSTDEIEVDCSKPMKKKLILYQTVLNNRTTSWHGHYATFLSKKVYKCSHVFFYTETNLYQHFWMKVA